MKELEACAADARVRFQVPVFVEAFRAEDFDDYASFWQRATKHFADGVDGVVVCHGMLPDQQAAEQNLSILRQSFEVNFLSVAALLEIAANYFFAAAPRLDCRDFFSSGRSRTTKQLSIRARQKPD